MFIYNGFDKSLEDNEIMRKNIKNIVNNIINLSEKIDIKDNYELSLCNLYAYLLNNGFLSIDKTFDYSIDNIKHNYFNNIMLGYGCCRNISDGLKEVLDAAEVKNCVLSTTFNLFSNDSEHCLNLVIGDKKYFMYDITNMYFIRKSLNLLRCMNAKNTLMKAINVKTTFDGENYSKLLSLTNKDYDKRFSVAPVFKDLQKYDCYKLIEYLNCYEDDINCFKENEKLFNMFYTDSYDDIKSVNDILIKR